MHQKESESGCAETAFENATHFQQICAMTNAQTNIFAASELAHKIHIS